MNDRANDELGSFLVVVATVALLGVLVGLAWCL